MNTIKIFFASIIAIAALDLLWVGFIANSFYYNHLSTILRLNPEGAVSPRILPVILIYISMAALVTFFVLNVPAQSSLSVLLRGALFGLLVYGFYNFTNLALIEKWDWSVALIDTLWGAVIFGFSSFLVAKFVA
ncbi:MAG TPA: DUF2177 family protein [Candidatus Paceibacterota bacterium]